MDKASEQSNKVPLYRGKAHESSDVPHQEKSFPPAENTIEHMGPKPLERPPRRFLHNKIAGNVLFPNLLPHIDHKRREDGKNFRGRPFMIESILLETDSITMPSMASNLILSTTLP